MMGLPYMVDYLQACGLVVHELFVKATSVTTLTGLWVDVVK